ncbi:unnamed protein product [Closterium sp. NIES-65]|nr:unnamed protein product [Closterium sp. NIES-65]
MVTTPPLHPYFLLPHSPSPSASHPPWAGRYGGLGWELEKGSGLIRCGVWKVAWWWCGFGAECLAHSPTGACRRAARSAVLHEAGQGSGGGGAGEAVVRERGCRDPPIPRSTLIPCHTFTSCPPPLLRSVVPPQSSSSPSPFLPSSISLPHYPLYPLCCPSSLPPILPSCHSSSPHPPSIQPPVPLPSPTLPLPSSRQPCSSVPPFYLPPCTLPHFFLSSAHHQSAHHLIRPSSHPPIISSAHHLIRPSSHPPILSSAHPRIRPSSHPPILSSAHPLIRPSSHPPILSSAHHLIRPSSHPPILSSAHHLIHLSSHRRPRFCLSAFPRSLSPTHVSSCSPFHPSSVSPLLIFCLRAFFVPHHASEFVVRVFGGLPCIQLC